MRRLSWKPSQEKSIPWRRWGTALSHDPFHVAQWRLCLYYPPPSSFRLARSDIYLRSLSYIAPSLALYNHALWQMQLRQIPHKRDTTSSPQTDLEVICALSIDDWGYGILQYDKSSYPTRLRVHSMGQHGDANKEICYRFNK